VKEKTTTTTRARKLAIQKTTLQDDESDEEVPSPSRMFGESERVCLATVRETDTIIITGNLGCEKFENEAGARWWK
jgi:hypothetical protein